MTAALFSACHILGAHSCLNGVWGNTMVLMYAVQVQIGLKVWLQVIANERVVWARVVLDRTCVSCIIFRPALVDG